MRAVVLGLGQRYAGDDAVGLAVVEALQRRGVDARPVHDASSLVALVPAYERVVVVDAVTGGGAAGQVQTLDPEDLARARPLSSHGLSVLDALGIVRALHGDAAAARVRVVGVTVAAPMARGEGMSEAVRAAVAPATEAVMALLEEVPCTSRR